MKDFAARALDIARQRGAAYADIRVLRTERELIAVKNGTVEALRWAKTRASACASSRDGAWGFAGSSILTAGGGRPRGRAGRADRARQRARAPRARRSGPAVARARHLSHALRARPVHCAARREAGAAQRRRRHHAPGAGAHGRHRQPRRLRTDQDASPAARAATSSRRSPRSAAASRPRRSPETARCRRAPTPIRSASNGARAASSWSRAVDLPGNAERIADEAVALLTAKPCPAGVDDRGH